DSRAHQACSRAVAHPLIRTLEISGVDRSDPEVATTADPFKRHAVTPEEAAATTLEGVRKGRYIVYTSRDIRLGFAAQKFAPPLYNLAMRLLGRRITKAAEGMLP